MLQFVKATGLPVALPLALTNAVVFQETPSPRVLAFAAACAVFAYGGDRLGDGLRADGGGVVAAEKKPKDEFYAYVREHSSLLASCVLASFAVLQVYFARHWAMSLLLLPSIRYERLKRLAVGVKPAYVGAMWSAAAVFVPGVVEHGLSWSDASLQAAPVALLFFAASTCADVEDVAEDTINGVPTLPVALGVLRAQTIAAAAAAAGVALLLVLHEVI